MGYLIKYGDIRYVREKSSPDIGKTIEALLKLKEKITELIEANRFRGKSADSIKIYMQDVHFSLINSIIGLLQLYYDKLLLYCDDYYQYDSDKNAVIPESEIDFLLNDIPTRITSFQTCCSYFSADVRCIGDLFDPNNPDISFIERDIKGVLEKLKSYKSGVEYHESIHKDVSDMETLLNSINASINEYDSKARSRLLTYNEGDYFKSPNTFNLFESSKVLEDFYSQRGIEGKLQAANEHQVEVYKQLEEEFKERQNKRQALALIISGTLIIAVGALCVACTLGAAIPVIAAKGSLVYTAAVTASASVFAITGTITVGFGTADVISGIQTIQHDGDASYKTLNDKIIDNFFNGNEKKYNIHKKAFTFASSAFIPISNAFATSTLTFRSAGVIVAKEAAGVGVGFGTDWLADKAGLNMPQRFFLGIIASYGTSATLNKLDAKFNISGFNKTLKSPKVETDVDAEIPKLQNNVNGEVPKIKGEGVTDAVKGTSKTLNSFDDVADYIKKNGKLPDNFITKDQAKALGWDPKKGNLADVAHGKSIGGDIFKNKGTPLPDAPGRVWYEADINYSGGFRGTDRIIYSNDGLIYKTSDHYKTFTQIK